MAISSPCSPAFSTRRRKLLSVPNSPATAVWPPSALPMAHGQPGSADVQVVALLRPLRCVCPIGWIGGRYSTSNPICAISGRSRSQSRKVPCRPPLPNERGNSSYHALNTAFGRSTMTANSLSYTLASDRSGYRATSAVSSSLSAIRTAVQTCLAERRRRICFLIASASDRPARFAMARSISIPIRNSTATS